MSRVKQVKQLGNNAVELGKVTGKMCLAMAGAWCLGAALAAGVAYGVVSGLLSDQDDDDPLS